MMAGFRQLRARFVNGNRQQKTESRMSNSPELLSHPHNRRSDYWKWYICGLLLLATMLNYMDRQTLSQTATDICRELSLDNEQYGDLEMGFGLAFAAGGVITGFLVDRISVRWMYPIVLLGWSIAGFSTAHAEGIGRAMGYEPGPEAGYAGLLLCRVVLGIFEAGQWPCALVTSQRLLSRKDRTLGNSILQSGASLGAIITPVITQLLVSDEPGSWKAPFQVIGVLGTLWIIPWLLSIRAEDVALPAGERQPAGSDNPPITEIAATSAEFFRKFLVLVFVVTLINLCWHFFRAWLPKFLREFHMYAREDVNWFTSAYYIAADVGCLCVGFAVRWLVTQHWNVHRARMAMFLLCAVLTSLSAVAAYMSAGPALLGMLLLIGFGALGLFPCYYSFSQELSARHQGKVTGALSCINWIFTAIMQKLVGREVDESHSYATQLVILGLAPLVAWLLLVLFWPADRKPSEEGR
jgi:ACS family hexuronate transporter-like MFS transporter